MNKELEELKEYVKTSRESLEYFEERIAKLEAEEQEKEQEEAPKFYEGQPVLVRDVDFEWVNGIYVEFKNNYYMVRDLVDGEIQPWSECQAVSIPWISVPDDHNGAPEGLDAGARVLFKDTSGFVGTGLAAELYWNEGPRNSYKITHWCLAK